MDYVFAAVYIAEFGLRLYTYGIPVLRTTELASRVKSILRSAVEMISLFCLGVQEQLGEVRFVFDLVQHVGHCSKASGHSERSVAPRR